MYICLVLDKECHVLKATVLKADSVAQAVALASKESDKLRAWGFELWREGRLLRSSYDCHTPPARIVPRLGTQPRLATP